LIPKEWLDDYASEGSRFIGHVDRFSVPFVEASTGSLGHGLPIGLGMAYALQLSSNPSRVFVFMSDGEIQEGTVWEAAHIAARLKLHQLTAIIDANRWQSYARTDEIMPISSFKSKWESFGWAVAEVDGHDFAAMEKIFNQLPLHPSKPSIIIAHTTKGKGIKEFEDKLGWHYWSPKPPDVDRYLKELDEKCVC
jgi:transketolase